jgi:hypothetical protein
VNDQRKGWHTVSQAEHTGRCLCGAVGYRTTGAPKWIANCHCGSCRRATGAPLATYAGYPAERCAYVAGEPVRFHSSPAVTRAFCGRYGTPLAYEGERWPGEVHGLTGSMDRPEDLVPARNAFAEEKLPWVPMAPSRGR